MIDPIENDDDADIFGPSSEISTNSLPSFLTEYVKKNPNLLNPLPHQSRYPKFVDLLAETLSDLQRYIIPSKSFYANFSSFNLLDEITGGRATNLAYNLMLQSQIELNFNHIKFFNELYLRIKGIPELEENVYFQEVMRIALTYVKVFQYSLDKVILLYRDHCSQTDIPVDETLIETGTPPVTPASVWFGAISVVNTLSVNDTENLAEVLAWRQNTYINTRVDYFIQTLYNKLHSAPKISVEILEL